VQHTPRDGYVLTDPSTGFVLRGLALLNSSTAFIIRGRTPSPAENYNLAVLIYRIFHTQNATEIPTDMAQLPQRPDFVVITTRTVSWVAVGGVNSTYYAPTSDNIESFAGLPKFSSSMFSLAASWQTVRIYQLNTPFSKQYDLGNFAFSLNSFPELRLGRVSQARNESAGPNR
jgi:hypothetical protein